MRISDARAVAIVATVIALFPFVAGANDTPPFGSPTDAYHQGMASIKAGETKKALPPLQYAADHGVLGAQLKLARIYAGGNGVPKDSGKAFSYYRQIANQQADISPSSPIAKYVAEAFVALGKYYLDGIPASRLPQDPVLASDLFRHAASYFGDADAQYALAMLYLDGTGVEKNVGLAVNWLATAARKQHPEAQAKLGELLWHGGDVRQRPARGLALIMLAHTNAKADGKEPQWIADLCAQAEASADAATLKEAQSLIPELGGPAEAAATVAAKAVVPDKVAVPVVPAAAEEAPKSDPGVAADAGQAVVSSEPATPAHVAPPMGVPVGFGFAPPGDGSGGLKP